MSGKHQSSAAVAAKKSEEQRLAKIMRALLGLPHNRNCSDCGQLGPTYVNMTIGSFICTQCSGILRGLNKPHRVKSVSLSTFTNDEVELLRKRGNEYCRRVYLGIFDFKTGGPAGPVNMSTSPQGVKEALMQKYDARRWYLEPAEELEREATAANAPAFSTTPAAHTSPAVPVCVPTPLAAIPRTSAQSANGQSQPASAAPGSLSKPPAATPTAASTVPTSPRQSLDILADVFAAPVANTAAPSPFDPFGAPAKAHSDPFATAASPFHNSSSGNTDAFGGQAWANFPNSGATALHTAVLPPTPAVPGSTATRAAVASSASASALWPSAGAPTAAAPSASAGFGGGGGGGGGGDKYAALAELDNMVKYSAAPAASSPFAAQPYAHMQPQYGAAAAAYEYPSANYGDPFNVPHAPSSRYAPPVGPRPPHGAFAASAAGAGAGAFGVPSASAAQPAFDPFTVAARPAPAQFGGVGSNPWAQASQSQQPPLASSAFGSNAFAPAAGSQSAYDAAGLFGAPTSTSASASRPPDAFAAFGAASASRSDPFSIPVLPASAARGVDGFSAFGASPSAGKLQASSNPFL